MQRAEVGELTQRDRELIGKVFSSPLDIPPVWKTWLKAWLESDPPRFLATQMQGYAPLTAHSAAVPDSESTTSTSYTNLGTTGPEVTDLEAGQYLILFGVTTTVYNVSDKNSYVSPSLNGAGASDSDCAQFEQESSTASGSGTSIMRAIITTLPNSSNSVLLKYKVDSGGTAHFKNRWLITLRTGNV